MPLEDLLRKMALDERKSVPFDASMDERPGRTLMPPIAEAPNKGEVA